MTQADDDITEPGENEPGERAAMLEHLTSVQTRLAGRAALLTDDHPAYLPLQPALAEWPATIVNDITVSTVIFLSRDLLAMPDAGRLSWRPAAPGEDVTAPWLAVPVREVIERYRNECARLMPMLAHVDVSRPIGGQMGERFPTVRSLLLYLAEHTAAACGRLDMLFDLAQGGYDVVADGES